MDEDYLDNITDNMDDIVSSDEYVIESTKISSNIEESEPVKSESVKSESAKSKPIPIPIQNNKFNNSYNNTHLDYMNKSNKHNNSYSVINSSPVYKNYFSAPENDDAIKHLKSQYEYIPKYSKRNSSTSSNLSDTSDKINISNSSPTLNKTIGILNYSLEIIQEKFDNMLNPK